MRFTKQTLNDLLEEIVVEYFKDDKEQCGLQDVIEIVVLRNADKINTLED